LNGAGLEISDKPRYATVLSQRFELSVTNDATELPRLTEWLTDIARRLGLPRDIAFRLDLCLHEAVSNVMNHGKRAEEPYPIEVHLLSESDSLTLEIEDDGIPFDPSSVTEIPPPSSLAEAKVGGWGIPLIRRFADRCHYDRRGSRNHLVLLFRRAPESEAPPNGAPPPADR